ncbi:MULTISPECIES: hypothetical protein [unclassified Bradyrhizobium]|uniref:hypothetical protein n=1 Tax=unclassified Bradyrhizobium TaxID=2631580 RepID=UPI001FF9C85B|nr:MULTISPECIES: hypothetical protein [unclassified Bradyrhizobium]MCK1540337.1 hypothetical protein [Bradyrhizobium sp. 176]MCK1556179.1 hypothetical protein [Bradyrhizobium sp. 171]
MNDFAAGLDPYQDLPEDPEEAFLKLEAHFFAECERKLEAVSQNDRIDIIYVNYIAKVLAASKRSNSKVNSRAKSRRLKMSILTRTSTSTRT